MYYISSAGSMTLSRGMALLPIQLNNCLFVPVSKRDFWKTSTITSEPVENKIRRHLWNHNWSKPMINDEIFLMMFKFDDWWWSYPWKPPNPDPFENKPIEPGNNVLKHSFPGFVFHSFFICYYKLWKTTLSWQPIPGALFIVTAPFTSEALVRMFSNPTPPVFCVTSKPIPLSVIWNSCLNSFASHTLLY